MTNSSRIEAATREFVGAILTGQEIARLVHKMFPDWTGGIYPSDCAYVKTANGFVPRGKSAYGDGVLEYKGSDSFRVLPTEAIVRKPSTGRGRGSSVPRTDADIDKALELKKQALAPVPEPKGKGKHAGNGESAQ